MVTKGETLAAYAALNGRSVEWRKTRSCWQDNRQVSVDGQHGAVPVIDERKARRICSDQFPETKVASTVDLLCHDAVIAAVGSVALADAVFAALRNARMRVLAQHEEWVVGLIGTERAQLCASLSSRSRKVARQVSETK